MLNTTLIGRLGKDATTNTVGNRVAIGFSVACDLGKNQQGEKITRWVRCTIWRDQGKDAIAKYLRKGTQVYLEGTPDARAFDGQNGVQASLELTVWKVKLLSSEQQQQNQAQAQTESNSQQHTPPPSPIADDSDEQIAAEDRLPF